MNLIPKFELYGLIVAAIVVAALGWGWHEKNVGVEEERARWERKAAAATQADLAELQIAVATSSTIAQTTATTLAKRSANSIIDRGVIEREIRTDIRYVNTCLPDVGRMQWNALLQNGTVLSGSSASTKFDELLPDGNGKASAE